MSYPLDPRRIRRVILEQSFRARVGHIGCALSVADILAALYGGALEIAGPDDPDRDRFVLSKGHAALALYAALYLRGWLSDTDLDSYCADNSLLGVHPEHELAGVDFSTGSLGQGLSMGAGCALAARVQGSQRRVFVLMSDGECNEGSIWEAAMFAAHHNLSNLIGIVDLNGQQALGNTKDVLEPSSLEARWKAFGWDTIELDGHDAGLMLTTLRGLRDRAQRPTMVVARTTFGKGVSFMESQLKWHYWPMNEDEYRQALLEVVPA